MSPRPLTAIVVSSLLALTLVACGAGDTIDPQKTQVALEFNVKEATGQDVETVTCPADVPVSIGTRFTCLVVATTGDEAVAELEITSDAGDLRFLSLDRP